MKKRTAAKEQAPRTGFKAGGRIMDSRAAAAWLGMELGPFLRMVRRGEIPKHPSSTRRRYLFAKVGLDAWVRGYPGCPVVVPPPPAEGCE